MKGRMFLQERPRALSSARDPVPLRLEDLGRVKVLGFLIMCKPFKEPEPLKAGRETCVVRPFTFG